MIYQKYRYDLHTRLICFLHKPLKFVVVRARALVNVAIMQEQLDESCVGIVSISITEIKNAVDTFNHFEFFVEENPSSLVLKKVSVTY